MGALCRRHRCVCDKKLSQHYASCSGSFLSASFIILLFLLCSAFQLQEFSHLLRAHKQIRRLCECFIIAQSWPPLCCGFSICFSLALWSSAREKNIKSNETKSFLKGERRFRTRRRKAINSFNIEANDVELFMKPHKKNLFVNTNCFRALVVQFQMMTKLFYTILRRAQQTNSRPLRANKFSRSFSFLYVRLCFLAFHCLEFCCLSIKPHPEPENVC